jgi:ParB family transcriptional regulator, chromosome partitioning protein
VAAERAEAASVQRRRVIAGNKAWDAAVNVRRAWLRESFQCKTPPAGAVAFIAHAVVTGDHAVQRAFEQTHPLAVDLFGIDGASRTNDKDVDGGEQRVTYPGYGCRQDLATLLDGASDKRLTLVTLAVVMAAYEAALDRHSWRHDNGCPEQHYLRYLDTLGYTLRRRTSRRRPQAAGG